MARDHVGPAKPHCSMVVRLGGAYNSMSVGAMISDVETLASQIVEGSTRGLARGLTWVESGGARAEALCARLYPHTGRAQIVGVTGAPGSGKSTLARALALVERARGRTVGILAVDPSSPFSGGAILGDRIRMSDLTLDPGVFIRSMATRGALGGLSRAAADAVDLMDAAGLGLVLVETVGVGQDEVDVMRLAHTIIVVSVPGLGDDVQALKAGVLEIADVHVVNKADRDGADRTVSELRAMLTLLPTAEGVWIPPVLPASAARDEGIEAIADALDSHMAFQKTSGQLERRRRKIVTARVLRIAQDLVAETVLAGALGPEDATRESLLERVARRELAPHACARALLAQAAGRASSTTEEDVVA
jgi:LAO/AO transport system kinase